MPGLRVLGTPETSLIAITGAGDAPVDPFRLADAMRARGWTLQPSRAWATCRAPCTHGQPVSLDSVDHFIADLQASAAEVSGLPWVDVSADIEAAFADLPDLTAGEGCPRRMASVHALIDALPPEIRDPALSAIFSALFTARRD